jgi:hypothetical protein
MVFRIHIFYCLAIVIVLLLFTLLTGVVEGCSTGTGLSGKNCGAPGPGFLVASMNAGT